MRFNKLIICLFIFFRSFYCKSIETSPVYGYHLKTGVPEARRILSIESQGLSYRIVGGLQVTDATAIPHQAGIIARLIGGQSSVCGGSLISATRVLTAAHCWFDGQNQARQFTIVLGSRTIFSGGTRIDTSDLTMHPSWNYLLNDIAIVKIAAVKLSNTIAVIPLPTTADVSQNFVGSTGQISGYGKNSDGKHGAKTNEKFEEIYADIFSYDDNAVVFHGNSWSGVKIKAEIAQNTFPATTALHQTTVPVITNAVCQNSFKITIAASHLCTSGTGSKGTCDGDSGGPLTVLHNNKRILVGVVSFGPSEGCQASAPSVFTRVTAFLPWINSHL